MQGQGQRQGLTSLVGSIFQLQQQQKQQLLLLLLLAYFRFWFNCPNFRRSPEELFFSKEKGAFHTCTGIKFMFLVGGFADSPMLQTEVRSEFQHVLKVIIPNEISLAVLRGQSMTTYMRRLQLRFDFDSTGVRPAYQRSLRSQ